MNLRLLLGAAALVALPLTGARAQAGMSLWAGYAKATNDGRSSFDKSGLQLGAQFGLPIIPIGVRGEALTQGAGFDTDHLSYLGSALWQLRVPVAQVYAIGGVGHYGVNDGVTKSGWHLGAGARAGIGRLGVFAELRRHDPLKRTITTVGVTF